jgi:hypothetical protein
VAHDRPLQEKAVDKTEINRLQNYLRKLFNNTGIRVVPRMKKNDSCEVYIGEEFIGVISLDAEDGERDYAFQMAILGTDLD